MFAKHWQERWRRSSSSAGRKGATGRLGLRALVPLMMFVVCVLGVNEPPGGGSASGDETCPSYDESTFPPPSPARPPAGAGKIDGAFSVSETGEARYTIPLIAPPGRAGMEPRLALTYSSNAGQSIVGVGFGLQGFSAVTRCGSNLARDGLIRAVRYGSTDHFCLDGARLVVASIQPGVVEYRTFPDTFKKVLAHFPPGKAWDSTTGPESFEVFTKEGRILRYGATDDSRPMAKNGIVASWWISREEDRHANAIEYAYYNDLHADGYTTEHYPKEIRYTSNGSAPPTRAVRFEYEDHQASAYYRTFYSGGMELHRSKLLSWVRMIGPGDAEVRSYELMYTSFSGTYRPLLDAVWEWALGVHKPPTRLTWSSHAQAPLTRVETNTPAPPDPTLTAPSDQVPWVLADVTGDGLDDIVTSRVGYGPNQTKFSEWRAAPNATQSPFFDSLTFNAVDTTSYAQVDPDKGDLPWSGIPFDYDMDGRKDFLLDTANTDVPTWRVLHALPGGNFEEIDTGIVHAEPDSQGHIGVLLADLNGDGAADLIECDGDSSNAHWTVRFGAPEVPGFEPAEAIPPLDGFSCELTKSIHIKVADLDADGKLDLLVPNAFPRDNCTAEGTCNYGVLSYLTGSTWTFGDAGLPSVHGNLVLPDVNGDGLPDAVLLVAYAPEHAISPMTYMNTGRGFAPATFDFSFPQLPEGFAWDHYGYLARLIDYNGDGAVDILMPMDFHCDPIFASLPCWVVLQAKHNDPGKFLIKDTLIPFTQIPDGPFYYENTRRYRAIQVTDVDGDGRNDIVVPELQNFAVYKSDGPQDLLVSITDGMSPLENGDPGFLPNVSIEYGNLVDYAYTLNVPSPSPAEESMTYLPRFDAGDDCSYPRTCAVGSRRVVSKYRLNNGANQARSFSLRYRDGRVDHLGGGFLGFGSRIVIDESTQAGTVELYDNKTFDPAFQTYPYVGHRVQTWSWTPGMPGQIELSYTNTRYQVVPSNVADTYFTLANTQRVQRQEGQFAASSTQTYFSYTQAKATSPATILGESWHLVTDFDVYGNILGEHDVASNVDLETVRHRVYTNDPASWLIGRLDSDETCSTALSETKCKKTEVITRDQYGEVVKARVGDPSDPQTQLTLITDYDTYGNAIHATADDAFGNHRWSCVAYDPENLFPYATRNSQGHTTYTRFDRGLGVVTAEVDPNGLLTQKWYDGFGRQVEEKEPDGTVTTVTITTTDLAGPQGNWKALQTYVISDGHGQQFTEYDSLGRAVLTWSRAPEASVADAYGSIDSLTPWYLYQETQYDALGRMAKVSLPWKSGDPASSRLYHELEYDGAGRVVTHRTPWNSTIEYAYGNNITTKTDSAGTSSVEVDGIGRRILATDKKGKTTSYVYGPFSGLRSVTNVGETTTTVRDAYGRVRESYDPDRHSTTTDYDGFGEVTRIVDALGRLVELEHDSIGRLVRRIDPSGTTTWEYDIKSRGIGKIGRVSSPFGHVKDYEYDNLSRLQSNSLTIDGETFSTTFDYDSAGRLAAITYPEADDGVPLVVTREYDHHGNLLRVVDKSTDKSFWQLDYVDRAGRPVLESFGNGTYSYRSYFEAKGTARAIQTGLGPAVYQDLRYAYDDRLNVSSRTDALQESNGLATAELFKYDELDRLTCAAFIQAPAADVPAVLPENTPCALSLTYAANGNIDHKSDVGAYKYHSAHPHAVETAGADLFEYDEVGNQIARPGATITYTPFDLPARITKIADGTVINFAYDGDQQRIRKTTSKADTIYFDKLYERVTDSDGVVKHRYYVPAGAATVVVTRVHGQEDEHAYIHPDVLGSPDVVTDAKGNVVEQQSYDAFGARRNPKWGEPPSPPFTKGLNVSYTGHEPDDEVGLVNMRGRIYDARVARFLQTDPLVSHPGFSQSWNAYSYVMNNPMKWVDPSGFDATAGGAQPVVTELPPDPAAPGQTAIGIVNTVDSNLIEVTIHVFNSERPGLNGAPPEPNQDGYSVSAEDVNITMSIAEIQAHEAVRDVNDGDIGAPGAVAGRMLLNWLAFRVKPNSADLAQLSRAMSRHSAQVASDRLAARASQRQSGPPPSGSQSSDQGPGSPLALPPGSRSVLVPNRLQSHEVDQARKILQLRGGTLVGQAVRDTPGIDGTLNGTPISLKAYTGRSPSGVLRHASRAEERARAAGYSGVEVFIEAPNVPMQGLLNFATGGPLTQIPRQGTIRSISVLTADGWLVLPGG
jgi:RHS repeat-associated protein